jgi:hypothetical protein
MQSRIGLRNFACCVVLPGRTFLLRLIDLTRDVTQPHHHIKLSKENRLDIQAWFQFIQHSNGEICFWNKYGARQLKCIGILMLQGLLALEL